MSDDISLTFTKLDGAVVQERVPISQTDLYLTHRQLVAVSDNIAQLTCVVDVQLYNNALNEIPLGVLAMTQLTYLTLTKNRLVTIPREIGHMRALTGLHLGINKLTALPREIGRLGVLGWLDVNSNSLTSLPAELSQLSSLRQLFLHQNRLAWLPMELDRLPATTEVYLMGNVLPVDGSVFRNSRRDLPEIFAATTALAMIREEATTLAIGLQDLELPALVTLEIIDAAFPNSIPMYKKWDLITAVKHFHARRGNEA